MILLLRSSFRIFDYIQKRSKNSDQTTFDEEVSNNFSCPLPYAMTRMHSCADNYFFCISPKEYRGRRATPTNGNTGVRTNWPFFDRTESSHHTPNKHGPRSNGTREGEGTLCRLGQRWQRCPRPGNLSIQSSCCDRAVVSWQNEVKNGIQKLAAIMGQSGGAAQVDENVKEIFRELDVRRIIGCLFFKGFYTGAWSGERGWQN